MIIVSVAHPSHLSCVDHMYHDITTACLDANKHLRARSHTVRNNNYKQVDVLVWNMYFNGVLSHAIDICIFCGIKWASQGKVSTLVICLNQGHSLS